MISKKGVIESNLILVAFKPNLGFLSASFASLLTILTINQRSNYLLEATEDFSIGIPLIVATIFLSSFDFNKYLILLILNN